MSYAAFPSQYSDGGGCTVYGVSRYCDSLAPAVTSLMKVNNVNIYPEDPCPRNTSLVDRPTQLSSVIGLQRSIFSPTSIRSYKYLYSARHLSPLSHELANLAVPANQQQLEAACESTRAQAGPSVGHRRTALPLEPDHTLRRQVTPCNTYEISRTPCLRHGTPSTQRP